MTSDDFRSFTIAFSECLDLVLSKLKDLMDAQAISFIQAVELGRTLDDELRKKQTASRDPVSEVQGDTGVKRVEPKPTAPQSIAPKKRGRPKKQK